MQQKIEERENQQIEVLLKIDGARETAELAQGKITQRVAEMEDQRNKRAAIGEERKVEVEELKKEIEETRKGVEPSFLSTYDRVTKIVSRPPYMAPINDQKCSGCHLRVSNDVVSSVLVENKITQCDQCGRIVYVERWSKADGIFLALPHCFAPFIFLLSVFPRSGHSLANPWVGERKVRTSKGRIPCESGGGLFQDKFTASATENKPPPFWGKGEKVG